MVTSRRLGRPWHYTHVIFAAPFTFLPRVRYFNVFKIWLSLAPPSVRYICNHTPSSACYLLLIMDYQVSVHSLLEIFHYPC